jgi:hypothetical protein
LFVPQFVVDVLEFDILGIGRKYEANALEFLNLPASMMSAITAIAINTLTHFMLVSIFIWAVKGAVCSSIFSLSSSTPASSRSSRSSSRLAWKCSGVPGVLAGFPSGLFSRRFPPG